MKKTLPVLGMACAGCVARVEKALKEVDGVKDVSVSLAGRSVTLEYDSPQVSLDELKQVVSHAGYDLVIEEERDVETLVRKQFVQLRRRMVWAWIIAIPVMALSMHGLGLSLSTFHTNLICMGLSLLCMGACGSHIYHNALRQARHGEVSMDSLVALSTGIAFLFSTFNVWWGETVWGTKGIEWHTFFDACTMIIAFVLTGRLLEEKAKNSTASSIRKLMGMTPKTVHVVVNGTVQELPLNAVEKGDLVVAKAGERIPVDGIVVSAESYMSPDAAYIDEASMTGEPMPQARRKDHHVMAGSIVSQGKIMIKAESVGNETALAHIIKTVQEAQASKAPVQRIADKAAGVFVPAVMGFSMLTFFLWLVLGGKEALPQAVLSTISILVIACPCAMGLATPTAMMVGMGRAAERQILIKDATALEKLCRVSAVVVDKTGTLTQPSHVVDFTKAENMPATEREQLKPDAKKAIDSLHKAGVKVVMMSGDKEEYVSHFAKETGISDYHGQALSKDKENKVKQLQAEGHVVAMLGDGINDTQALAAADVSIAIGQGTDVAMDVAQVTLMGKALMALPESIMLSRETVKHVWQNLAWAFGYNIVCIPLAAGVLKIFGIDFQITPIWSSALMALSSLSVVANSLVLKWKKIA